MLLVPCPSAQRTSPNPQPTPCCWLVQVYSVLHSTGNKTQSDLAASTTPSKWRGLYFWSGESDVCRFQPLTNANGVCRAKAVWPSYTNFKFGAFKPQSALSNNLWTGRSENRFSQAKKTLDKVRLISAQPLFFWGNFGGNWLNSIFQNGLNKWLQEDL